MKTIAVGIRLAGASGFFLCLNDRQPEYVPSANKALIAGRQAPYTAP
jgi:hypothetical protein